MEHIWAPWRIQYIQADKPDICILCEKPKEAKDEANYILYRGKGSYVILNAYPYNPGHVLVAPYRHVAGLNEMTLQERSEYFEIVNLSTTILKDVFKPGGMNIGINIGRLAGAGIDDHVHTHIVPRWQGDTNFITVIADLRVIPEALSATYDKLRGRFQEF